ncbi:MAG: cytochrome P450 [Verrucomicrobiota bacterium]|nr:cytochrome P450 [Verrucomicrobiota bacterium]
MSVNIPYYAPNLLEKRTESNSQVAIDFRGYTIESFLNAYRECGPVYRTHINGLEEIIVGGLEANDEAWRCPDQWSYSEAVKVFREELSDLHLTQLDREPHRRKRRLLNKAFKTSSIMDNLPQIAEEIQRGLEALAGEEVELHEALMEIFTRSQSVSSIKEKIPEEMVKKMVAFEEGFLGALFLKDTERARIYSRAGYKEIKKEVLTYLHEIILKRLEGNRAEDLLDTILHQRTSNTIEPLSEKELIYDAYLLLIAGTGNTSKTLCYCLNELASNPEWTTQLVEEIGDFKVDSMARGMADFPLLKATIMEAERLFPAAPVLPRVPAEDMDFIGHHLNKGTHCLHMLTLMHFDESIYEDPFQFKPQRWLDHSYPKQAHGTFGGGSHICLGMNVARIQMPITLGFLLSNYNFTVTKTPKKENYKFPNEVDSSTVRMNVRLKRK